MISWIGAAFLVFGFLVLMRLFGLAEMSADVVHVAGGSFRVIRSSSVSDEAKETALQKDAKRLLRLFLLLTVGGAAAVLFPMGLLWGCDLLGWISLDSVFSVALSPIFLIVSSVLACLFFSSPRRKTRQQTEYSTLDRCLTRVAFKTYPAQVALADLEDRLFAKRLSTCTADRPVFITGLPRAGTTLLLECLAKLPEFASHCYRDMPFVLVPCLWSRFSARFQQVGTLRERAHGDGMLIGFDSPEALEEVLWKALWRQHYQNDRITPWQDEAEDDVEFAEFFRSHMRKIILLRSGENAPIARYISKNNLNIARTRVLHRLFPDSVVVVPFRQPLHHAASLLEQHRNFLRIHEEDAFASEYMRAIGHYDFGKNLCPVDFQSWLGELQSHDTESLAFWLKYWVATYRHLLTEANDLYFLSYDKLCEEPATVLHGLADAIGSENVDALVRAASTMHPPRAREMDTRSAAPSVVKEALSIYDSLREAVQC